MFMWKLKLMFENLFEKIEDKNPFRKIKGLENYTGTLMEFLLDQPPCEECGAVYKKSFMKSVVEKPNFANHEGGWEYFYCPNCAPNFDIIVRKNGYKYNCYYYKKIEVDKNGKKINRT